MRVFVTGATGAIGRWTVPALVAAGHRVTAIARTPEKADRLRDQGATPAYVSLFDLDGLKDAFAGHDAVANLATSIPPSRKFLSSAAWAANQRLRSEGSATVVTAALGVGVGHLVQESVAMLYRDGGASWLDEDAPVDRYPMAEGNHAAEASAARFTAEGGTGIVLRFGWFYGPGAAHSEEMLAGARRHVILSMGAADGYQSSIHVGDAAAAVEAALAVPAGTWNVVDDEPVTKADFARTCADVVGVHPHVRVPGRSAALFGNGITSLTRSLRVSNARLRNAAGWVPRYPSVREGLAAMASGETAP